MSARTYEAAVEHARERGWTYGPGSRHRNGMTVSGFVVYRAGEQGVDDYVAGSRTEARDHLAYLGGFYAENGAA